MSDKEPDLQAEEKADSSRKQLILAIEDFNANCTFSVEMIQISTGYHIVRRTKRGYTILSDDMTIGKTLSWFLAYKQGAKDTLKSQVKDTG